MEACNLFAFQMAYVDQAECVASGLAGCTGSAALEGSGLNAANLTECSTALAALSCTDFINGALPAVCNPSGTLANGAACSSPVQCTSGACGFTGGECGTCVEPTAHGAACTPGTPCADGDVCVTEGMSPTGVCKTPGALGSACDPANPCLPAAACVNGTCAAPLAAGAPCDPMAPACDVGLQCPFGPNATCAPVATAGTGEACGFDVATMAVTLCKAAGTCSAPQGGGTCNAAVGEGAACDPFMGPQCRAGFDCVAGTCAASTGPAICE